MIVNGAIIQSGVVRKSGHALRAALRDHARRRWPRHTAKFAERGWRLNRHEARRLAAGCASLATVEKVLAAGGWDDALPILTVVIGHPPSEGRLL